MYTCMHICTHIYIHTVHMLVRCMHVCRYVYVYVCLYVGTCSCTACIHMHMRLLQHGSASLPASVPPVVWLGLYLNGELYTGIMGVIKELKKKYKRITEET